MLPHTGWQSVDIRIIPVRMQALGIGILAGACVTKLPQILNVYTSKSGEGLPLMSSELENYVYMIHVSYGIITGLPFTAFGEAAVTWLQNLALLALLYQFKRASPFRPMITVLVIAAVVSPVYMGLISPQLIHKLYDANSTIYMASRLPQLIAAFQQVCLML
jgi:mannose-P-dolichol utilization defect 1